MIFLRTKMKNSNYSYCLQETPGKSSSPEKQKPAVDTPLAGMLPEKYKSVDIKTVFPEFRENSVLRFSTLFPIKVGHNCL